MILSEICIEEFPRRRRQIIIKKYPRELYSPFADHPGVYLIKQSQFLKSLFKLSELGDRGDQELEQEKKKRKIEAN